MDNDDDLLLKRVSIPYTPIVPSLLSSSVESAANAQNAQTSTPSSFSSGTKPHAPSSSSSFVTNRSFVTPPHRRKYLPCASLRVQYCGYRRNTFNNYCTFVCLLLFLHTVGLYLFTTGFLLTRIELSKLSSASDIPGYQHIPLSVQKYLHPKSHHSFVSSSGIPEYLHASSSSSMDTPSLLFPHDDNDKIFTISSNGWSVPLYDRFVLIIIDAWRYDFARWRYDIPSNVSITNNTFQDTSFLSSQTIPNAFQTRFSSTTGPPLSSINTVTSSSATIPPYINAMPLLAQRLYDDYEQSRRTISSSSPSSSSSIQQPLEPLLHYSYASLVPVTVDAPTVTMQRIKGITAGNLPTFIDISNNFASTAINEDNLLQQLARSPVRKRSTTIHDTPPDTLIPTKQIHFMGDDTWMDLFPHIFASSSSSLINTSSPYNSLNRAYPYPSFNVKDLHTVDNGIIRHLFSRYLVSLNHRNDNNILLPNYTYIQNRIVSLQRYDDKNDGYAQDEYKDTNDSTKYTTTIHNDTDEELFTAISSSNLTKDWDVLIGHFLGVDHVGHRYGPSHPSMQEKLHQMDKVLQTIVDVLNESTEPTNDHTSPPTTLLVVLGDHGMTEQGNHGGSSNEEIYSALYTHSFGRPLSYRMNTDHPLLRTGRNSSLRNEPTTASIAQIDIVPTLALALGIPIPYGSLGALLPSWVWLPSSTSSSPSSSSPSSSSSFLPPHHEPFLSQNIIHLLYSEIIQLIINYEQVHRYLSSYAVLSKSFNLTYINELEQEYEIILTNYYTLLSSIGETSIPSSVNDDSNRSSTSPSTKSSLLRGIKNSRIVSSSSSSSVPPFSRSSLLNTIDPWFRNLTVQDTEQLLHHYPSLITDLQSIQISLRSLLSMYASLCRNLWTQFDTDSMVWGMILLGSGLMMLLHAVYSTVFIEQYKEANERILYQGQLHYNEVKKEKDGDDIANTVKEHNSSSTPGPTTTTIGSNILRHRKMGPRSKLPSLATDDSVPDEGAKTTNTIMDQYTVSSPHQEGTVTITVQKMVSLPSYSLLWCLNWAFLGTIFYAILVQPVYTLSTFLTYTEMMIDSINTTLSIPFLFQCKVYLHAWTTSILQYPLEKTLLYFVLSVDYHPTVSPIPFVLSVDKQVPLSVLGGIGGIIGYSCFVALQYWQESTVLRYIFPSVAQNLWVTFLGCGRLYYSQYIPYLPSTVLYPSVTGISFTSGSIFILLVLRLWSLFTNSFIITEDQVTVYFLIVTILLITVRTVYRINEIMLQRKVYSVPMLMYIILGISFLCVYGIRSTNMKASTGIIQYFYRSKNTILFSPDRTVSNTTTLSSSKAGLNSFFTNDGEQSLIEELYRIESTEPNSLLPVEAVRSSDIAFTSTGLPLVFFPISVLILLGYGLPYLTDNLYRFIDPHGLPKLSSSIHTWYSVRTVGWIILLITLLSNIGVYIYWYQQVFATLPFFLPLSLLKSIPYRLWGPRAVYLLTLLSLGGLSMNFPQTNYLSGDYSNYLSGNLSNNLSGDFSFRHPLRKFSEYRKIPSSSLFLHRYQYILLAALSTYPSLCLVHGPWSPLLLGILYYILFTASLLLYILYELESYVKHRAHSLPFEASTKTLTTPSIAKETPSSSFSCNLTWDSSTGSIYTTVGKDSDKRTTTSTFSTSPPFLLHYSFSTRSWFWIFRLVQSLFTEIYHFPPILTMFIGMHYFHATGHAHQFSSLNYNSAFIGFEQFSFLLSGLLLFINTFGFSHLVGLYGLSFLFTALPAIHYASSFPSSPVPVSKDEKTDNSNASFPPLFIRVYRRLVYGWYVTCNDDDGKSSPYFMHSPSKYEQTKRQLLQYAPSSLVLFCTCIFCFIVRRELMVWAIFAPKYSFESIGHLLTDILLTILNGGG